MKSLSCVQLFATLWTVSYQAPPSMGFSRQEYWSGLPFPSPGDLPNPGIKPGSPTLQADALTSEPPEKPLKVTSYHLCHIMCHNWHLIMFTMFNGLEVSHRSSLPSRGEDHTGVTGGCATELLSGKWGLEPCHTASLQPRHLLFPAAIVATWNCSVSWVSSYENWKYFDLTLRVQLTVCYDQVLSVFSTFFNVSLNFQ